MLRLNSLW